MALDFPASPSIGQTYPSPPVGGQPIYKWDGEKWTGVTSILPPTIINENFGGYINKIRNGTFDIWQRGTSGEIATTGYYADGWYVTAGGATATVARATNNRAGAFTKYAMTISGNGGMTNTDVRQRIESHISAAMAARIVTLQAQVYNGTGAAFTPVLTTHVPDAEDNWTAVTTDIPVTPLQPCPAGQWTKVAITFIASADAGRGYAIVFPLAAVLDSDTKSITIAEVDLRITPDVPIGLNIIPPTPEMRPVTAEQVHCERYFRWLGFNVWFSANPAGQVTEETISFSAMRAKPTVSTLSPDPNTTQNTLNVSTATFQHVTPYSAGCNVVAVTGTNTSTQKIGFRASASAEL